MKPNKIRNLTRIYYYRVICIHKSDNNENQKSFEAHRKRTLLGNFKCNAYIFLSNSAHCLLKINFNPKIIINLVKLSLIRMILKLKVTTMDDDVG